MTNGEMKKGQLVTLTKSAVLCAAIMGVQRAWRVRAAREKTREFADRRERIWLDDVIGAIGELAVATHLRVPWLPRLGADVKYGDVNGYQVKASVAEDRALIYRPGSDRLDGVYVLVVGDGFCSWRIVGWRRGHECINDQWAAESGRFAYFVPQAVLHDIPPGGLPASLELLPRADAPDDVLDLT